MLYVSGVCHYRSAPNFILNGTEQWICEAAGTNNTLDGFLLLFVCLFQRTTFTRKVALIVTIENQNLDSLIKEAFNLNLY